ncbi:MAG: DUF4190 domain-containing protein [Clostridia bacterium]|nr:DUF4190 domain-containing protein [Clostridia bacterium]
MFCDKCGCEISGWAKKCPNCGIAVPKKKKTQKVKYSIYVGDDPNNVLCVLAVVGYALSFWGVTSIVGLICCSVAYRRCERDGLLGKRYAVCGIVVSVVYIIVMIFLAVTLPFL